MSYLYLNKLVLMMVLVIVFTANVGCFDKDGFVDTFGDSLDPRYLGSTVVAFNDILVSMTGFITSSAEPFSAEFVGNF